MIRGQSSSNLRKCEAYEKPRNRKSEDRANMTHKAACSRSEVIDLTVDDDCFQFHSLEPPRKRAKKALRSGATSNTNKPISQEPSGGAPSFSRGHDSESVVVGNLPTPSMNAGIIDTVTSTTEEDSNDLMCACCFGELD